MKTIFLNEDNIWEYADGVDFCVIFSDNITHSYTKEEFKNLTMFPKNNRRYWIMKEGHKIYFNIGLNKEIIIHKNKIFQALY